jgi:hypothetical protein
MIVFDLRCPYEGHVFEAWFGSSEDYESQRQRRLVQCPLCGSPDIDKAAMAPRLGRGEEAGASSSNEEAKELLAAMAAAQKKLLEGSDYVGERFADEARAIHLGEADFRSIHGRATPEQADGLRADGIQVAPLPFPVIGPEQAN